MNNVDYWRREKTLCVMLLITMAVQLFLVSNCCAKTHGRPVNDDPISPLGVTLNVTDTEVVIDNGIVQITIANPEGHLLGVRYDGVNNLLEAPNKESNRGYWDVVWDTKDYDGTDWLVGSKFNVIVENEDQVEVSFTYKWDSTTWNTSEHYWRIPANVDRRYIMLRESSGFYAYMILERTEEMPAANIFQIRTVYKLDEKRFQYMAISDDRQRIMPLPHDRESGLPLAFKEAVLLTNPTNPDLRGEVDDKYQYSCEDKDNKVHGWISLDPQIGFWIITPSDEFRSAGPIKQDLTSHVGPTALAMFHSAHYAGLDVTMKFQEGEPWKKVFGPYYVYLNSIYENGDFHELWDDAKHQMKQETRSWPYEFPLSEDFPKSVERGFAYGRLLVHDRYRRRTMMPASYAWIGLAAPGEAGSWQTETKGYQFWTRADRNGGFLIKGIHEGVFNLFAWVPGFIGDYVYAENIIIEPGSVIQLGNLVYEPPRNGPTLWQIGIPDRTALEFYVPEPSSLFVNKLYTDSDHNKFRQYGLWERYAELYPENDLIYTVGESDYHTDWFFAHVTRKGENNTYLPTTWQIIFTVNDLIPSSNYTLRIALASATRSDLQVQFNHEELMIPHFSTKMIGSDNAIARHGIHGLYRLFNIDVPSEWLYDGNNTIYLKQSRHDSPFYGVMYDYIRFEAPPRTR
ncbi:probable rhamnogalacturonate lyase B [Beta vulgaris subsp. vulgaris]|uniref:probable rhamnogalacturonate lyase B n=1 Tax=Beta vulgaris subsp. vulgaris TaxID=3555 RepID=UPI0020373598|nr:probable rhamnogalacturonate lyase B [Beta vulgaris subsp. vulgaris]